MNALLFMFLLAIAFAGSCGSNSPDNCRSCKIDGGSICDKCNDGYYNGGVICSSCQVEHDLWMYVMNYSDWLLFHPHAGV